MQKVENDILRRMRRSVIWLVIAILWMAIAVMSALRRQWQIAPLQAAIAIGFIVIALYTWRKENLK